MSNVKGGFGQKIKRIHHLQRKETVNNLLLGVIMHISDQGKTSLEELRDTGVLPKNLRCFRDLSSNVKTYLFYGKTTGNKTVTSVANLTDKGRSFAEQINEILSGPPKGSDEACPGEPYNSTEKNTPEEIEADLDVKGCENK